MHRGFPWSAATALMAALIACSLPPQGAPESGTAAQRVESAPSCSPVGVLACKAMALFSSGSTGTCSAVGGPGLNRTEICGYSPGGTQPSRPAVANPNSYPVHLTWSDNSDNESHFVVERCDQIGFSPAGEKTAVSCAGVWREIGTAPANTGIYVDHTASRGRTYLYRVKSVNSKGSSAYTQDAAITTPPRGNSPP